MRWVGVPGTDIEISDDGEQFRWTFDYDGAEFLVTELYPDATGREMQKALDAADEARRIRRDTEQFGIAIVMVARDEVGESQRDRG